MGNNNYKNQKLDSQETNIEGLRDNFFRCFYEGYKDFLTYSKPTYYMNAFIDYAIDHAIKNGKTPPSDEIKYTSIQLKRLVEQNEEDVIISVWEFFDVISQNPKLHTRVYNLMHYDGQDNTIEFIEEEICRCVLQWFWNKLSDSGRKFFTSDACTRSITKEENKKKKPTEDEIFEETKNTETARIIEMIGFVLRIPNNRRLKLYPLGDFLKIRNYMRNYSAHELNQIMDEDDRKDAIKKILYDYVGIVLGLRIALEDYLPPVTYPLPNHSCHLRIFYEKGVDVSIMYNHGEDIIVAKEEYAGEWKEYILDSSGDYIIRVAKAKPNKKIKQKYLNCLYPVASVNNERIKLFRSYAEMDDEAKKNREDKIVDFLRRISRDTQYLRYIFYLGVFVVTLAIIFKLTLIYNYSNNDDQNVLISTEETKSINVLKFLGDSLLNIAWNKDYRLSEQVGQTYREAIGQLRSLAEQHNSSASIDLCHLYLSGKGCYNLDSAFYYVQKKEVRETKEGQGLYAYLLLKRGEMELARKEFLRAIDPEEPYICLTKALYDMHNSINSNQTTMQASKQTCESAYQSLSSINNDDAICERAMIDLWGIRDSEDDFIIHPNFGKAFNALYGLANRNPFAILVLGDIYNMMGDVGTGLNYHWAAFYCGVQEKAAIAINSSLILNPNGFSLTDKGRVLKEIAAGKTNVIGGVGGCLSDYVHYIDGKAFDLAIKVADSLYILTQQKNADISINDTSFVSTIRITSRLMSGKSDDFSEAVRLAMQRDNCTDSIAVADYLKGVCLAKGYGCQKDINKSDELILSSAERGTYTEALFTNIKRHPPILGSTKEDHQLIGFYLNPSLLKRSPKLASAVADFFFEKANVDMIESIKNGTFNSTYNSNKILYDYQIGDKVIPFLPKEWSLMNKFLIILHEKCANQTLLSNTTISPKDMEGLAYINDYICLAMDNGQSHMAQVGCSNYKRFCDKCHISQDIGAYERFRIVNPKENVLGSDRYNDLPFYENPMPQYMDYAY